YDDPTCIKETTWGKDGIRSVLIGHVTEDGTQPVQEVMLAKAKLDEKRLNNPKEWTDSSYNAELSKIKAGDITGTGEKIQTMTVIIKPTDEAAYTNVVEALDEMQICSIGKYVIDDINPDDEKLLEKLGIK
ncbi:MAG: biopolymer transporter ExbD, partial [Prevotella sp.]|nr:biopolymer transporter ExbD [Prevotella sp.]